MGIPALPFSQTEYRTRKPLKSKLIENPTTIGEHIRNRRLQLGVFQEKVAEEIGVSADCITNWENNRTKPQIHFYPKIIAFLNYYPFPKGKSLASKIKMYRHLYGLNQKQLGQKLRVDGTTIGSWEIGKRKPINQYLKLLIPFLSFVENHMKRV